MMSFFAGFVLVAWIPLALCLFLFFEARRATILVVAGGWLFLPAGFLSIQGLPNYDKAVAACGAAWVAALLFDRKHRLWSFRPSIVDVPMIVWCLCPLASSVSNGLGVYDGASAVLSSIIMWGLPYQLGRAYFGDFRGMRELAVGVCIAGLIYAPLILWESRMSSQLHYHLYGYDQNALPDHKYLPYFGSFGYEPRVFLMTELAVSFMMAAAVVSGVWLYRSKVLKRAFGLPMGALVPVLAIGSVFAKGLGAAVLTLGALGALFSAKWFRIAAPAIVLVVISPLYLVTRTTGEWSGDSVVSFVSSEISPVRARSLAFRLYNEGHFVRRSMERPVFGWGGYGRNMTYDESRGRLIIPDGHWVIAFSKYGFVGLISLFGILLAPGFLFLRRYNVRYWARRALAPAAALTMICTIYAIDSLLNHMENPLFVLANGGVCSLCLRVTQRESQNVPGERADEPFVPVALR